ncbi:MAG: MFS transporter [Polyangiaceae bacterium]|nr:MFS transporter [Polyangiaceae bacterium]
MVKAKLDLDEGWLVAIDTAMLAAYAVGQFASGAIGDRHGARKLIALGMIGSALACAAFGLSDLPLVFALLFGLNGLFQSSGWPGTVKAMAEWTAPARRGRVMGLWATCYQVGGIAATAVATFLLAHFGWRAAFLGPALWVATVGIAVWALLRPGPFAERRASTGVVPTAEDAVARARHVEARTLARRELLVSRVLWCYGLCYFCLKLIRYSILSWLAYYFTKALHLDAETSGYLSTSFEIGGFAGTVAMGWISDKLVHKVTRAACAAVAIVGLAGALLLYSFVGASSLGANFASMALVGALLFAADSLISGAAAQDAGGAHGAGLAAGVVNGVGSLGAVLQGVVTIWLKNRLGWSEVFLAFVGVALLGALALVPVVRRRAPPAPAAA